MAVDHRLAIRDGGAVWDPDNLVACCTECHNRKTRYVEQLGRDVPVKGCDPNGLPLDPNHWWREKNCSERPVTDRRGTFERS
jgi:hypothetical protein